MAIYPHLAWYTINGRLTLYRRDLMPHRGYATFAEACDALGLDLEDEIRSR